MESRDYETILDAMPATSVFVIREADCGLLYLNQRAEETSPEVRLGSSCCALWTQICGRCPLLCMGNRQEGRFISYYEPFGGMVELMAARILWEETPAFVITVLPWTGAAGCSTYHKILRVHLMRDCCDVLRSAPDSWEVTEEDALTEQLERFARSGAVHPSDVESFVAFVQMDSLRSALEGEGKSSVLLYRGRTAEGYRWNQIEVFPEQRGNDQFAILCVKEVQTALVDGPEVSHVKQDMQMAAILKSRFKTMNTVELDSGRCFLVDLTHQRGTDCVVTEDYNDYVQNAVANEVHPDDIEKYQAILCLEHLRKKALELLGDYEEEVCVYRKKGLPEHWMELRVIYSRQEADVIVNILGQDVTSEKRREESQNQAIEERSYIISSLSSLFFSTYYIDLEQNTFRTVTQLRRVKDVLGGEVNYTAALEIYANHFVHPEDRSEYLNVMGIENLRQCLRWWNPYVAVEYRKLSEEQENGLDSWEWVRATAVLARTSGDDMPNTVVYAAQNIANSKRKA